MSALAGCAQFPADGPSSRAVANIKNHPGTEAVQVVDVDDGVARRLSAQIRQRLFSDTLGQAKAPDPRIGIGDVLEINIWEAPPATLFGAGSLDLRNGLSASRPTALPEQVVDSKGMVNVPFAGRIAASGRTLEDIENEIATRLRGKANHPEVMARVIRNGSALITVVGEVSNSVRMPLTPSGERLLDALAAAGGVRQPVNKMTLQVTRGNTYYSLPMDTVIRDPRQNVPLWAGDVVTAIYQPLSFSVLGATGKNEEINFEAQGISLAQALARSGGLLDPRADAHGVFVFRFEEKSALDWPKSPAPTTPEGTVPVVYRMDLQNPNSFFVMQSFPVSNKDIIYVSTASVAELQKFLNLVFSVTYPILNTIQLTR